MKRITHPLSKKYPFWACFESNKSGRLGCEKKKTPRVGLVRDSLVQSFTSKLVEVKHANPALESERCSCWRLYRALRHQRDNVDAVSLSTV